LEIIPVIDLMDGHVVHARFGDRQLYQPIQSSLCANSEPLAVVEALLELYPFEKLYIADLDAIQGRGNHREMISLISQRYPELKLWLDAGISKANDLENWLDITLDVVIGSESLDSLADFESIKKCFPAQNHVLSLDFTAQGFQGPDALLLQSECWPQRLIAMTLGRVGSNSGPDEQTLRKLTNRAHGRAIYAAGGVRNIQDIRDLQQMGVAGALVASALHTGRLAGQDIAAICKPY
jgi:phosphoribosylformimino-5-aminoimidazole carboxamide ribotide isomerase